MRISYLGPPGSFSHQACLAFASNDDAVAEQGFTDIAEAVLHGRSDRGVLPLENVKAGSIDAVWRLLDEMPLRVVAEHRLPVRLHLLGLSSARLEDIEVAVSHPVALAQCEAVLARYRLRTEEAASTAAAARDLRDPSRGALASDIAAEAFGLTVLLCDVQDPSDNSTLFALVARA